MSLIFGIQDPTGGLLPTFDLAPLQSASPWGHRPGPTSGPESPCAIHFGIALLGLAPQAETWPIFGIQDPAAGVYPPFDIPTTVRQSMGISP